MTIRLNQALYLRQDVQVEPLFNQWRAWTHLIPPATAAMRLVSKHLPLINSYIADSDRPGLDLRYRSNADRARINHNLESMNQIRDLLNRILIEQAELIRLAAAIKQLSDLLADEARGFSLAPLYQKVPASLKGYVELVYDLSNNPSIRFIEGLLYKSSYYKPSSQSYALTILHSDERPSNAGMPRLESETCLLLNRHFAFKGSDLFLDARRHPTSLSDLKDALELDGTNDKLFHSFLTEAQPAVNIGYTGEGVRLRYLGHASVLLESRDCAILIDPIISYKYPSTIRRYTYEDLPERIDYILITHGHQDHLDLESLLQLRHMTRSIVVPRTGSGSLIDPSLKLLLQNIGFQNVIEVDEMDTIQFKSATITAIPFWGEHSDLNVRAKTCYAVRLEGKLVLCMADSCNIEPSLYENVHEWIGDVDVLFIGMECEGSPLSTANMPYLLKPLDEQMNQSRRTQASNSQQAIEIVRLFRCKKVYVYAMGLEPWLRHLFGDHRPSAANMKGSLSIRESDKLVDDCKVQSIMAERLFGKREIILRG